MKQLLILQLTALIITSYIASNAITPDEITPFKYTDLSSAPSYVVPTSSRYTIQRSKKNDPEIVCYMSFPEADTYPIALICTGSSTKNDIKSIIHFHRYFLQEFMDLKVGLVTVEQWGVDGDEIDLQAYINNYTRTQRLNDHKAVIKHLQAHPPTGWNKQFIFLGVSEGGPLVTQLTSAFQENTIATINWCGAGDWNWHDELWAFMQDMSEKMPVALDLPTKEQYDELMLQIVKNPCVEQEFMGMTYKYHADALHYPMPDYHNIATPFLVVAGAQDSIIQSSDAFVQEALSAGMPTTYMRIADMDHYIRKRPDIIENSFKWLKKQLKQSHPNA